MAYSKTDQDISNLYSVLVPGQSSDQVKQLQQSLITAGFNIPAGATGYYGPQTQSALDIWKKQLASAPAAAAAAPAAAPTPNPAPAASTASGAAPAISPDDQKLLSLGVTPDQLKALSTPNGLDPVSFQALIGNIETKLKTNNELVTQRGYLVKHLFDSPLTPEELAKLPQDIQDVVKTGDKDNIQLQLRLLNDQISGRANTLTQSISTLVGGYQTAVTQAEQERADAVANVQNFVSQYGSNAPAALKALYGQTYLDKLKAEGIDINAMVSLPTVSQTRYQSQYGSAGGVQISIPAGSMAANNNNPGNLKYVGQTGATMGQGGFAKFDSPQAGYQALLDQIGLDQSNGLTVSQFITKYAPPTENNTAQYIQQFNQALGTTSNTKISTLDPQDMAAFIAQKESGAKVTLPDIQEIAQGIEQGMQPPVLTGLYGKSAAVRAQLQKDGFNLAKATQEWTATQKFLATLNGSQQTRLRQAISSVTQAIGGLRDASNAWNAGGFGPFNAARLKTALSGALGQDAQKVAAQFQQQSTIIQDELGQTFMGGNSPTDKALGLASQIFDTNWSNETMQASLDTLEQNLQYRVNAIEGSAPAGVAPGSAYAVPGQDSSSSSGGSYDDYLKLFGTK